MVKRMWIQLTHASCDTFSAGKFSLVRRAFVSVLETVKGDVNNRCNTPQLCVYRQRIETGQGENSYTFLAEPLGTIPQYSLKDLKQMWFG